MKNEAKSNKDEIQFVGSYIRMTTWFIQKYDDKFTSIGKSSEVLFLTQNGTLFQVSDARFHQLFITT